jgi:hypothetical protein
METHGPRKGSWPFLPPFWTHGAVWWPWGSSQPPHHRRPRVRVGLQVVLIPDQKSRLVQLAPNRRQGLPVDHLRLLEQQ